jgi:hypothetical protein
VSDYGFDFELFFATYKIRRFWHVIGTVFVILLKRGKKCHMEYRMDSPLRWETKFISDWSEDFGDCEWTLSQGCEFPVGIAEFEVLRR